MQKVIISYDYRKTDFYYVKLGKKTYFMCNMNIEEIPIHYLMSKSKGDSFCKISLEIRFFNLIRCSLFPDTWYQIKKSFFMGTFLA